VSRAPVDLTQLSEAQLLRRLRSNADRIRRHEAHAADGYTERLGLFLAARDLEPPVLQSRLAEAAGISEVAVTQAFRKHRHALERKAAGG
jgi:aconitase B